MTGVFDLEKFRLLRPTAEEERLLPLRPTARLAAWRRAAPPTETHPLARLAERMADLPTHPTNVIAREKWRKLLFRRISILGLRGRGPAQRLFRAAAFPAGILLFLASPRQRHESTHHLGGSPTSRTTMTLVETEGQGRKRRQLSHFPIHCEGNTEARERGCRRHSESIFKFNRLERSSHMHGCSNAYISSRPRTAENKN